MDIFNVPLNSTLLIRKKKSIKKELLSLSDSFICKKIAILGGSTTQEVADQIELFLLNNGIKPTFYQSDFGKYYEDAVFSNPTLDAFNPDIIYIHTSWRNISCFPEIRDSDEDIFRKLTDECNKFNQIWKKLDDRFHCPIIQNNFDRPNFRLLGNRDIWDLHGRSNFIFSLNSLFYEYAQKNDNLFINDLDYISSDLGLQNWEDHKSWELFKYACSIHSIPYLAKSVADIVKSIFGKNKKVITLDLDNTIWGGVIGEDGVNNIEIGRETAVGQIFSSFQEYCKRLKQIGAILTVNSKNNDSTAIEGMNHPENILKKEDFVCIKANWNSKDKNIFEISKELSLGLDSFVFIDDNPSERDLVKKQHPEVSVLEANHPNEFIQLLDHSGFFEVTYLTKEDLERTEQYSLRRKSIADSQSYKNYSEYLANLNMTATVYSFVPTYIQRIAQLTNKTNQFNLTTLRCSESDIEKMQSSSDRLCVCARLTDKFVDNGIVTVISGKITGDCLVLDLWLMSCRVLKRNLEHTMMDYIVKKISRIGIRKITGIYVQSNRNSIVSDFYKDMGFSFLYKQDFSYFWELNINDYKYKNPPIELIDKSL